MTAERSTSYRILHLCNYSVLILVIGALLGFAVFAGFWPPPPAYLSASDLGSYFREHSLGIRVGMMFVYVCAPFYLTWTAVMAKTMERIQSDSMNVLPQLIRTSGVIALITLLLPALFWTAAAFRPDSRSDGEIQMLYDLGWFIVDPPFIAFVIEWGAIGICMLSDKREQPLFPSWIAWFGFFTCAIFISVTLVPFLTTGIFAWHGLVTFWVVFITFFAYLVFLVPLTRRALLRLEAEDRGNGSLIKATGNLEREEFKLASS